MVLIAATHQAAFLCLILVITGLTIVELVIYRNIGVLKNYGAFLLSLLVLIAISCCCNINFQTSTISKYIQSRNNSSFRFWYFFKLQSTIKCY